MMDTARRETLWEMIHGIRFAMLTTRSADGALRSRPLTTQNRSLEAVDPVLWFFVTRDSEVAADAIAAKHAVRALDRRREVLVRVSHGIRPAR